MKERIDINNNVKVKVSKKDHDEKIESLLINSVNCSLEENASLSESNREISVHIAGCLKRKVKKRPISYCHKFFVGDSFTSEIPDFSCMQILSRGRLTGLSVDLENYLCMAFSIFDSWEVFTYSVHESARQVFAKDTIANIYFNNTRKTSADLVVPDGVKPFKRRIEKRSKLHKGFCKFTAFSIWKQPSRSALLGVLQITKKS